MTGRLHKLTRTGDSYQVTIPIQIARRWIQDDVVAVDVEWKPPVIVLTPIYLRDLHRIADRGGIGGAPSGDPVPSR